MKTKQNSNLRKKIDCSQVIDLYINQGRSQLETAQIIGCSTATLARFLRENNIVKHIRDLSDPVLQKKILSQIDSMRKQGYTLIESLNSAHINHNMYKIMLGKGLKPSTKINENLVSLTRPEICYILGLIVADGHIDRNTIIITQCNHFFLSKIQQILQHQGVIYKNGSSTEIHTQCYSLKISSPKLANILHLYKVQSDKRHTAPFIDCKEHESHFIRGLFDGDGCLYYSYVSGKLRQRRVSITSGSQLIINGIANFLKRNNIEYTIVFEKQSQNTQSIFIDRITDIIKFLDIIYTDKNQAFLDRKYIEFLKFKKLIEINNKVNDIVGSKGNVLE